VIGIDRNNSSRGYLKVLKYLGGSKTNILKGRHSNNERTGKLMEGEVARMGGDKLIPSLGKRE
jgi:hypothetical protein